MARVIDFGAAGDGTTDDTDAVRHAIDDGDGVLEFSRGTYRITAPVEIDLAQTGPMSVRGEGGVARIVMAGAGPAIRILGTHEGTADPDQVKAGVWKSERTPTVSAIEIVGEHAEADGIELVKTMQATLDRVAIRRCRYGVRLAERNRNVLITACHIYQCGKVGIFMDRCNLHQMIISACHVSYSGEVGIKSDGGDLHNLQITGNDIEYNYTDGVAGCADIWFDAREGVASEITIASNTIQARVSEQGTNLRVTGNNAADGRCARLIAITGNVLGSQSRNIELHHVERAAVTGNTLYDGKDLGVHVTHSDNVVIGPNTYGWAVGRKREMSDRVLVERASALSVQGMTFRNSRAEANGGVVELRETTDSAVSDCQIVDAQGSGVRLESCRRCRVTDNSVTWPETGGEKYDAIVVAGASADNLLAHNLVQGPIRVDADTEANRVEGTFDVSATSGD